HRLSWFTLRSALSLSKRRNHSRCVAAPYKCYRCHVVTVLISSMKEIVGTRPRLIFKIIRCSQDGLADRRSIGSGVLEKNSKVLAIQRSWFWLTLGDSLGHEKQLGMPVKCENRRFVGAVSKESKWNSARLQNTRRFRVMKHGEQGA